MGSLTSFLFSLATSVLCFQQCIPLPTSFVSPRNILTLCPPPVSVSPDPHSAAAYTLKGAVVPCRQVSVRLPDPDQQADALRHSEGKVQKLYLFLSLTLLHHRAVIVNCTGAIKLHWLDVCCYCVAYQITVFDGFTRPQND